MKRQRACATTGNAFVTVKVPQPIAGFDRRTAGVFVVALTVDEVPTSGWLSFRVGKHQKMEGIFGKQNNSCGISVNLEFAEAEKFANSKIRGMSRRHERMSTRVAFGCGDIRHVCTRLPCAARRWRGWSCSRSPRGVAPRLGRTSPRRSEQTMALQPVSPLSSQDVPLHENVQRQTLINASRTMSPRTPEKASPRSTWGRGSPGGGGLVDIWTTWKIGRHRLCIRRNRLQIDTKVRL